MSNSVACSRSVLIGVKEASKVRAAETYLFNGEMGILGVALCVFIYISAW